MDFTLLRDSCVLSVRQDPLTTPWKTGTKQSRERADTNVSFQENGERMTEIEKLAEMISKLDINDDLQKIQIVILQGAIAAMFVVKKGALIENEQG